MRVAAVNVQAWPLFWDVWGEDRGGFRETQIEINWHNSSLSVSQSVVF